MTEEDVVEDEINAELEAEDNSMAENSEDEKAEDLKKAALIKSNDYEDSLQMVCAKGKEPYLLLIEGVKGGKSGIKILENLVSIIGVDSPDENILNLIKQIEQLKSQFDGEELKTAIIEI